VKGLSREEIRILLILLGGFLLLTAALFALNSYLIHTQAGAAGDFFTLWAAGRAFLVEKIGPYTANIPAQVQQMVYQRGARAGEKPYIVDLPFSLLFPLFPFGLFSNPIAAAAVWMLLAEIALVGLAVLSLYLTDWQPRRPFLMIFYAFAVLNFYAISALLQGGFSIFLGLSYVAMLFALRYERDELLGALLALSFFGWEVGGPFLLLIWWRVLSERRQRALATFGVFALVLVSASFLIYPDWLIPFLRAVVNNLRADYGFHLFPVFFTLSPRWGNLLAWAWIALLLIVLGYEWSRALRADFRRFYWTACLTLAVTPLLGFRSEMQNLVVLLPALTLTLALMRQRWSRWGYVVVSTLLLLALGLPWLFMTRRISVLGLQPTEITFLFYPILTVLGLYWIRWWAVRHSSPWLERVARSEYR